MFRIGQLTGKNNGIS